MNIILIGSGNVASVLGRRMQEAGHRIRYLWSRNRQNAERLSQSFGAALMPDQWTVWPEQCDMVFVSVTDNVYPLLAKTFPPCNMLMLHSAGAVPGNIFGRISLRTGVLYPLQSIRAETAHSPELPLLISAALNDDLVILKDFALSLSPLVTEAGDDIRMKYHVAAVFAANFANHLFSLTEAFCIREGLDFRLLSPLLEETIFRMRTGSPAGMQTGPALRRDTATIEKHLLLLKDEPAMSAIYNLLTKSIMDFSS